MSQEGLEMKVHVSIAAWTRYRVVAATGEPRRLLKVAADATGVGRFRLLSPDGREAGAVEVPCDTRGVWHFGFWVLEQEAGHPHYRLQAVSPSGAVAGEQDIVPLPAADTDAMPLRLDRTGQRLRAHLDRRETLPAAAALADFVPDMAAYLHQHRIIYLRPAAHWSDGLPLGNGTVGATVTGEQGRSQTFFLDRADLWAASPAGHPYGRCYAGRLDLDYETPSGRGPASPYLQELRLGEADVLTREGGLITTARVLATADAVQVDLAWSGPGPLRLGARLSRVAMPLPEAADHHACSLANGSWEAVTPAADIARAKLTVAALPHTLPAVSIREGAAVLVHPLPNMRYALSARLAGAAAEWRDASSERLAAAEARLVLQPGDAVTLWVAVTSDRDGRDPAAAAEAVVRGADPAAAAAAHAAWWRHYWGRCFVEFPDKLIENLWYFGAYHQAAFSRSLDASGFFALWHPFDHRTWGDYHVADAQTSLLWYAPFAVNHLELLLPSHHTFANLLPAFLAHNAGAGALVPHMFAPEWAGGRATFGRRNPYKGSIAWLAQNFWWDYLFTRDREFLADVAYPVIAALADFHAGDLVRGADGRLHCENSGSPEQNRAATDNVYDRACIGMVLKAAAEAAAALGVEADRAARWRDCLRDLFPFPADAQSLVETLDNHHPYRCHPVVLFGVHPSGAIEPGDPLWAKADATYDIVLNLLGFHFEDRHATIPGHTGGQEPNGHATAFLMHVAARLRGWREVRRLVYAMGVRTQLKRNGLRSICDPRHDHYLSRMAIAEATSGQTSGLSEVLVQSYSDHVRLLPFAGDEGVFRFAGLRAHGGFVLAAERAGAVMTQVTVHSLRGEPFRMLNPWPGRMPVATPAVDMQVVRLADGAEGLAFATVAGLTVRLALKEGGVPAAPPRVEARSAPRSVACDDWDDYAPPVVYYPEDPVFGQDAVEGRVFLGNPADGAADRATLPAVPLERIQALLARTDWPARQTAARWLGRLSTAEATTLLGALARDEREVPVVRYTAGVSLVRQGTAEALRSAVQVARAATAPHLRREIGKALGRLAHAPHGRALLASAFGAPAVPELGGGPGA